jgi:hypothetical protein
VLFVDLPKDIRLSACAADRPLDLNGDGLHDLVLGGADFSPPGRASAGGVFVLFGRRAWPARLDVIAGADVAIHGSRTGEGLRPFCAGGDFDGDGRTDLALPATEDTLWGLLGGRGRYYLFAGRERWPPVLEAERDARLRLQGVSSPRISPSAPLLVDINGDGLDDLIAAAPDAGGRGLIGVVFGNPSARGLRVLDRADLVVTGEYDGAELGRSLTAGEFTHDGLNDLVVSEPGRGRLLLIAGRRTWPASGSAGALGALSLLARHAGAHLSGLAAGDFDGDGATEVAFGVSPHVDPVGAWAGLVTPYRPIGVDIRPGGEPNVILRTPGSVLAVGVSSARSGPLSDLDPESFRLGSARPTHAVWRDFDGDGAPDLQLYFDAAALPVRADATRLALVGRTRRGVAVAGADSVTVVPPPIASASDSRRP